MTVHILGAGISGLVTAQGLLEAGLEVVLYESQADVGGVSSSFAWDEFPHLDLGPHIWHTPDERLREYWERTFGDLFHQARFYGKNAIDIQSPKFIDYPLSRETVSRFPPQLRSQVELELASCTEEERLRATSFTEYVNALVGPTLSDMFFVRYPQKLWGVNVEDMTADWAPKRIALTDVKLDFHYGQWSAVGKQGSGKILSRIGDLVVSLGGRIELNTRVESITARGAQITGLEVYSRQSQSIGTHRKVELSVDDVVVSTLPLPYFADSLGIPNTLHYRGAHLVFVAVDRPVVIPGEASFLYFGDFDTVFHRLSEQKKFCPTGFPESSTVLCAEVAFSPHVGPAGTDDALVARTMKSLRTWGLVGQDEAVRTRVVSLPHVYPVLTHESREELGRVISLLDSFEQAYFIGTGGEFHYADIQILFLKAQELAARIVRERGSLALVTGGNAGGEFLSKVSAQEQGLDSFTQQVEKPEHPFVVAEIGLNHGGSVEVAKELLVRAAESGGKLVKFQTYEAGSRLARSHGADAYTERILDIEESPNKLFDRCRFSEDEWFEVFRFGEALGLTVFTAVFDIPSLEMMERVGCPFYKIASMDVCNLPLIREIAGTDKGILMSTGMSTMADIDRAVGAVRGRGNSRLVLLHCVSRYPASPSDMNLRAIGTLERAFGVPVGLSDHTTGLLASTVALALGAAGVERHFTLSRAMEGPDHFLSSEPDDLRRLAEIALQVPILLGSAQVGITGGERENAFLFKKSLHAAVDISEGTVLLPSHFAFKGPNTGVEPYLSDLIVGRSARRHIRADDPITWEDV
jgi:N,N'-diacetyllegionaminate synthase